MLPDKRIFAGRCLCSLLGVGVCLLSFLTMSRNAQLLAAEPEMKVRRVDSWTNLFAGKPAPLKCEVSSNQGGKATLSWSLTAGGGILSRGEQEVELNAEHPVEVAWDINLPDVKVGLIIPAILRIAIAPNARAPNFRNEQQFPLMICSPDATSPRAAWLKSLDIVLFDPAERTANLLEAARIPFRKADDPQCAGLTKGLIIYGEGIDPVHLDAVWSAAIDASAAGRHVLMLASPGASVAMEGLLASPTNSLQSIALQRNEVIRELDKRFDATEWPKPGRLVASSLHWAARSAQPRVEFRDDAEGLAWLHIRHRNGGQLIWMGFGLAESWDATPTPRYLLLKVLEKLATDNLPGEGKQNEK